VWYAPRSEKRTAGREPLLSVANSEKHLAIEQMPDLVLIVNV